MLMSITEAKKIVGNQPKWALKKHGKSFKHASLVE